MGEINFWPPEPIVLGNRVFHWTCWDVVVNEIVSTARFTQLHMTITENSEPFILKSTEFPGNAASVGDHLTLLGVGDQNVQAGIYTPVSWNNRDEGGWGVFDYWEKKHMTDEHSLSRFGLPRKRKVLKNLLEVYYGAVCGMCLQICGFTEPELSVHIKKNVRMLIKTRV